MFPDPMRAFLLVVQTGSIRKASEQLQLNPSSVSRQIAVLERQCGTKLFRRETNHLSVTSAGALVAAYAETTVTGFDALRSDINDMRGSRRTVTVAMVESITSAGPAQAVARFCARHPGVTFDFHVVPAPEVIETVQRNRCEIGIAFCSRPSSDIRVVARVPEPIVLLAPRETWPDAEFVSFQQLTAVPLAVPEVTFGVRQIFTRACAEVGVTILPTMETNSFEALRDFVRVNAGVALMPYRAAMREAAGTDMVVRRIDHPKFNECTLDLVVATGQRLPKLTLDFVEELRVTLAASDVAFGAT